MQTIFITGSTSMIGAALVSECLKEGKTVYAMVRHNSPKIARLPVHENLHLVEGYLERLGSTVDHKGRQAFLRMFFIQP